MWWNFTFSTEVEINAGEYYWLTVYTNYGRTYYYDSGDVNQTVNNSDVPPLDDPFGTANYADRAMSIYATYIST